MYGGDRVAVVDHQQQPAPADDLPRNSPKDWRRRSADVGGLNLATRSLGQGQGWLGGDSLPVEYVFLYPFFRSISMGFSCFRQNYLRRVVE